MDIIREGEIAAIAPHFAGKIIDLGCGTNKVVGDSIGVDKYGKGEAIPQYSGWISVADVKANIHELPFENDSIDTIISFHSFEHLEDPIKAFKDWIRVLKPGGKICMIVPDRELTEGKDSDHKVEWTPEEFQSYMAQFWDNVIQFHTNKNNWSFDVIWQKPE